MAKKNKFGTFGGVFVPSILTILGVIMYLRLPNIIGEAGLWETLGIIVMAHIISFSTGLSVSSIATDKKVEAGGTYYMISRSLGLPIGGTLGLALFVGLSFSVSLYLIGFSESFLSYWGWAGDVNNIRIMGTIILLIVTTVTFISTSLAIKTQFFIFAAIVLSLVSMLFGTHDCVPESPVFLPSENAHSLMELFGIFFPAVTGFEAGVSMSGDLKNPKKSIPIGTMAAILVGFIVYVSLTFFFAYTVDQEMLINDPQILLYISWVPGLVLAGIWGATLSSALGSILGAPRILQATAKDGITRSFFAKGYGKTNEPRNALLLTFIIAEMGILIGDLNAIARIVSIFFITTYGFLNLSAAFERWTSADFRPEFKVSPWISVIGAVAAIIVMILLDIVAMLVATLIMVFLFLYLKRKELTLDSGDAWSGVWASLVKRGLSNLKKDHLHKRNWRPNILMFSGSPLTRGHLVSMGKAITGKLGILSAFELQESQDKHLDKTQSELLSNKETEGYFSHKVVCRDVFEGIVNISRMYGFSGIEPNTILMGWSKNQKNVPKFIDTLSSFEHNGFNTLLLNYNFDKKYGKHDSIDIWWSGKGRNLSLSINLLRFILQSDEWRDAHVRILMINQDLDQAEDIYKSLKLILDNYRVDAEIVVINNEYEKRSEFELITEYSLHTDLVILGLSEQYRKKLEKVYPHYTEMLESLGSSLVVSASKNFESHDILKSTKINQESNRLVFEQEVSTKSLVPSPYEEVNRDIQKIDLNGMKVTHLFFRKAFQTTYVNQQFILKELKDRLVNIQQEIDKISQIKELYKRKKAIDKLKNDTFYKLNNLLVEEMQSKQIPLEVENLQEGIQWYLGRLLEDFQKFPKTLKVIYSLEDLEITQSDYFRMRRFKRRKKLRYQLFKGDIYQKIPYRELARHYQYHLPIVFLDKYLDKFEAEVELYYLDVKNLMYNLYYNLDEIEKKIWEEDQDWHQTTLVKEMLEDVEGKLQSLQEKAYFHKARLQFVFRKELQEMSDDMSNLDVSHIIQEKKQPEKSYKNNFEAIESFSERYNAQISNLLNKIILEQTINGLKNRMEVLHDEMTDDFKQKIERTLVKELDTLESTLSTNLEEVEVGEMKVHTELDRSLRENFESKQVAMLSLTQELPEVLEIYSDKEDTSSTEAEMVDIPVARLAEHYFKTRYTSTMEEPFDHANEVFKRIVFATKDVVNLAKFNLENLQNGENEEDQKNIIEGCIKKIQDEKDLVHQTVKEFVESSNQAFDAIFEPLQSVKIEKSAEEYIYGVRSYQSKQVLSEASSIVQSMKQYFQNLTTKVLYIQSEGILYANKFRKQQQITSTNAKLLNLRESVSPNQKEIQYLPQYYISLFNGRSNIGQDFWVERPIEEQLFNQAIERFQQGYHGAILLVGERNSGKTALSRYMSLSTLKDHTTYNLFPPIAGGKTEKDFNQQLKIATQLSGGTRSILNRIPHQSVIMIHDLELMWERNTNGWDIIHLLESLIDEFSHKCLFVLNINPYAYQLIKENSTLDQKFIEIIQMKPFGAEEIKNLIITRHRSSGLELSFQKDKHSLSEVQLARLFNQYFNYSQGNPGVALNAWLANISQVLGKGVILSKPTPPSTQGFKSFHEDWLMLLQQFILHKRLDMDKIHRITKWETDKTKTVLLGMIRSGVIMERASGIYMIDPYMYPFIADVLKDLEVL